MFESYETMEHAMTYFHVTNYLNIAFTIVDNLRHSALDMNHCFWSRHQHEFTVSVKGVFTAVKGDKMRLSKHSGCQKRKVLQFLVTFIPLSLFNTMQSQIMIIFERFDKHRCSSVVRLNTILYYTKVYNKHFLRVC